eukprot:9070381-Lingulodinium_polyedra.AAC.1
MKGESVGELEIEEDSLPMAPLGANRPTKTLLAVTPGRKRGIFEPASSQEAMEDQVEQRSKCYPVAQHCEGDP